jgi:CCR4-NOT transcription complex subunit 3
MVPSTAAAVVAGTSGGPGTPVRGQAQAVGPTEASPITPLAAAGRDGVAAAPQIAPRSVAPAAPVAAGPQKQLPVGPAVAPLATPPSPEAADGGASVVVDTGMQALAAQLQAMGVSDSAPSLTPAQSLQLIQATALRSVPLPSDAYWQSLPLRPRAPPVPPPAAYPAQRHPSLEVSPLFEKMDAETLFFAFYHLPGTQQQLGAARELKRQAWRFHKQLGAWFQRHEEPRAGGQPGDEWEQGTYVYFDNLLHEDPAGGPPTGWCYRLKQDFLFKYDALEDEVAA